MRELPVGATAGLAYRFLQREAGTILRLSWFPLLLVVILQYVAARAQFAAMRSMFESGDFLRAFGSVSGGWSIVSYIGTIFGTAIVAVALHRVILFGDRKPGRFLHFAFGKTEMLFVLLPLIVVVPMLLIWFFALGFGAGLAGMSGALAAILFLLYFAFWVVVIFVAVRLCLVLPITVIQGRYDFGQAWSLTRGNFWRLVGAWILTFLPVGVAGAIVGFLIAPLPPITPGGGAGKAFIDFIDRMETTLPVQMVFSYIWSLISGALGVAVLSYSYKTLSGGQPDAVWMPPT